MCNGIRCIAIGSGINKEVGNMDALVGVVIGVTICVIIEITQACIQS